MSNDKNNKANINEMNIWSVNCGACIANILFKMNGGNNKWKHAQIKNDKSNNFIISKKHYLREAKKNSYQSLADK